MMISSVEIQNMYNDLYVALRKYIWGFDTVNVIADLEIASYRTCSDCFEIANCLSRLLPYIDELFTEDPDLKSAYDTFYKAMTENTAVYAKLFKVAEEVPVDEER